jgi:hypothetical protein
MNIANRRISWRQNVEFQTPLSVEECRQRLTMRNTPAEYEFIDNPGKFGVLGPSNFTITSPRPNSRWRATGTQLQGQLAPDQHRTVVRLRDTTPRTEFILLIASIVVSLAAAGFYYTQQPNTLVLSAFFLVFSTADVIIVVRLFRQRHREAKRLLESVRELLGGATVGLRHRT